MVNTILVPGEFMKWSNNKFASGANTEPVRLVVEVYNPTDDAIAKYFQDRGYEVESDKLDAGKTTFFLKVVSGIVLAVGLLISALSFYILMLSIYLLVQKNADKLQNLLLIGYSPAKPTPRAVTEGTDDGLHNDSGQWWKNPEITQTVRVCPQGGKYSADVGALQGIGYLHAEETETDVPQGSKT